MDFSVLISVYKNDNPMHFKLALESVSCNQTFKPTQIVLVVDGPVSDSTNNVISYITQSYPKIEWSIVRLNQNGGLAHALNQGLKVCKYNYVARMDADDIAVPYRFERQFDFLKKHPEISVLGSFIAEFKEYVGDMDSIRATGLSNNAILSMAKRRSPFNHMTVVFKLNDVLSVGGYSEDFGKLEDYKLWVDLISKNYKMANLEDILVNVRVGDGFIERRSSIREIKDWDNLQKHLLKNNTINRFDALINMLYIRLFMFTPPHYQGVSL